MERDDERDEARSETATASARSPLLELGVLSTRIRVAVRVRPAIQTEAKHTCEFLTVDRPRYHAGDTTRMLFALILDDDTANVALQQEFYDGLELSKTLAAVLEGYHATVFAYGQTGSGKTFTMEGYEYERVRTDDRLQARPRPVSNQQSERLGIIPRMIFGLFEGVTAATVAHQREFTVHCSFVQIYNEQIMDLLNPAHFLLASRSGNAARDFYVENLRLVECQTPDQVLEHFQQGIKHKIMASHNLNAASSRSHCIFTLYVESFDPSGNPNDVLQSKLALVDLAGSERVDKTGATGKTLQESIGINKSLFVLRQVIQALSEDSSRQTADGVNGRSAHIPYRDSKLTSLLKYSLGGNSVTLMIACLSPSDAYVDENLSTLVYASKAQCIANKPTKNEDPKALLILELRQEVERLRQQLAQAQDVILSFQQGESATDSRPASSTTECESCRLVRRSVGGERGGEVGAPTTATATSAASTAVTVPTSNTNTADTPAKSQTGQPPVDAVTKPTDTTTTRQLKMNVIDNVALIKKLYATEKELSRRVATQQQALEDGQYETRVLTVENQSLREKIEVLEYLVSASSQPSDDGEDNNSSAPDVIPEYGTLTSTRSVPSLPVPNTTKLGRVMRSSNNGNRVAPEVGEHPKQTKEQPETGLLSVRGDSLTYRGRRTDEWICSRA
ncbi:TPA: hypothetical protein N0F65_012849 [Lagenidium giganteum]|uniref:Kinesin-like protein n=1 Tax=Lagenidium giganteum TaxID=4803 RepID=A0AAV2YIK3_9STRA|nr:TPA: hypothetical protein N0F65_012849 [Lagenidium giganteum]